MARQYPHIDSAPPQKKWAAIGNGKGPKCDACDAPALYRVTIQTNWFRGDDETAKACDAHRRDAQALLSGLDKKAAEKKRPLSNS